jgi:ketosteroid isomerase-like protein
VAAGDPERLRSGYEAFNEGGVRAILELLDPDIHVRERGTMPDAASYHGRAGVQKFFDVIVEAFDDLQYEVDDIIDKGAYVIVVLRQLVHGRGSGIRMAGRTVHLWEMRNGRPVALSIFGTSEQALVALERDQLLR